jgi:hypothetical protein
MTQHAMASWTAWNGAGLEPRVREGQADGISLGVGRGYRMEGLVRGLAAVLEMDAASLVLDCPDMFLRRVLRQP